MPKKNIFHEMAELLRDNRKGVVDLWQRQLGEAAGNVVKTLGEEAIRKRSGEMLDHLTKALPSGDDVNTEAYAPIREFLRTFSRDCTVQNLSPSEVATYVFSMKDALLNTLQEKYPNKAKLNEIVGLVNRVVDKISLVTFETYVEAKEGMIREQQRSLIETAAPVVKVWDRILMVPLIGILDSERTQLVMDKMLSGIDETQSKVVILDITGIPTVDTLVARHLVSTATAVRLMGAECIVTGISARIAQTVVQMGVDLKGLDTKSSMADGLRVAFAKIGQKVGPL